MTADNSKLPSSDRRNDFMSFMDFFQAIGTCEVEGLETPWSFRYWHWHFGIKSTCTDKIRLKVHSCLYIKQGCFDEVTDCMSNREIWFSIILYDAHTIEIFSGFISFPASYGQLPIHKMLGEQHQLF